MGVVIHPCMGHSPTDELTLIQTLQGDNTMREVRLSIPVIGGLTVVYTGEEVEAKKQAVKRHLKMGVAHTSRFFGKVISLVANKIDNKPAQKEKTPQAWGKPEQVVHENPCPACGGPREDGYCSRHGKR